jgi:CheY-like chemotaxis protein
MAIRKVLVVDDEADMRTLIRNMLKTDREADFQIVEAATGTDALKAADRSGPFDLIHLDVGLPDMDGYSVCRAIRHVDGNVPSCSSRQGRPQGLRGGPPSGGRLVPRQAVQ